jgi:hypothetical protein
MGGSGSCAGARGRLCGGQNTMLRGEVVAEVDPAAFEPYAGLKWDAWPAQ